MVRLLVICGKSVATCVVLILARANGVRSKSARTFVIHQKSSSISSHGLTIDRLARLVPPFLLLCTLCGFASPTLEQCVPIRWTGGPLELAWRARTKTLPTDASARDTLAHWYEPATLSLLEHSPVNCLLVTWSESADEAVEPEQQQAVKIHVEAAHKRGLAVLGLVYSAGDASRIAADAAKASLDGLVLDGDFPPEFSGALRKAAGLMRIIEIEKDAAACRWKSAPVIAVAGVMPTGRNLSELGIRGGPSSQPWIETNIWMVRSFAIPSLSRPVWISSHIEGLSASDYARAVADAAGAGGHWIISLDDALRTKLRARDASALKVWSDISIYLKFAEAHPAWRALSPYGNVGFVVDPASTQPAVVDEYLKLIARRQVPYQVVSRSELNATTLAKLRAVVATELDPPSATERKALQNFAENGGVVFAGPSWGGAPKTESFLEMPAGKGSVIVYKELDPDAVARDLKEVIPDDDLGMVPFNVPSVITFASGGPSGQPLVVQLVNYFDHSVEAITLRAAGEFRSARLETPEGAAIDLPVRNAGGKTEVTIPKLFIWGAVSMQSKEGTQ